MARLSLVLLLALGGCVGSQVTPEAAVSAEAPASAVVASMELDAPPNDARQYRYLELDNGLRAVVVHDADTETAAAAMDVHVGQFSDPQTRQGLAHFLEHMLFLGTEKYPDIDDYRDYVQAHAGSTNASTSQEHTRYFFTIDQDYLTGGLDRFAQFFISPKIDPAYVDRERHAVESEYRLKIKEDARRVREVRRVTSNPAHPFHKFSVGNLQTLDDRDDEDLYAQLRALHDEHYRANRMVLGVISRQSLDELTTLVADTFADVPGEGSDYALTSEPLFTPEQLGVQVEIEPLTEQRSLTLEWPVPPDDEHWQERPIRFITSLLGQEAEGSLHALLMERGWIESLNASTGGTDDTALVRLSLGLTAEGLEHIDEITELTYACLALIRTSGIDERFQREAQQLAEINHRFRTEGSPLSAARLAGGLYRLPAEHLLDAGVVWAPFNAELVTTYLDRLTPQNMRRLVVAPGRTTEQVEPLYDTPFSIAAIEEDKLAAWAAAQPVDGLSLPRPNPFLPESLTLVEVPEDAPVKPQRLIDEPALELWHLADVRFGEPRARIQARMQTPLPQQGVAQRQALALWVRGLQEGLNTTDYQLGRAGISLSMGTGPYGITVSASGYSDKLDEALQVARTALLEGEVDEEVFTRLQDQWVRYYRDQKRARPISQSGAALSELLLPDDHTSEELAEVTAALTLADLRAAGQAWREGASTQWLVHGNVDAAAAETLARDFTEGLVIGEPAPPPSIAVRRLVEGRELVRELEIDHADSTFIAYYQGADASVEAQARWALLAKLMRTPFFTELRTERQLGYVVSASNDRRDLLPGLRLSIQSSGTGPDELQSQVDQFLARFEGELETLPAEDFAAVREGLITALTEPPTSLSEAFRQLQSDLWLGYTEFDRNEQVVVALEGITQQGLLDFYRQRVLGEGTPRLVVRSIGDAHTEQSAPADGACADHACVTDALGEVYTRTVGG